MKHLHENEVPARVFARYLELGKLGFQHCNVCSAAIFYPRVLCPACGGISLEWRESSGQGTVYATTTIYRRDEKYNVALIDLAEGFRMMSRIESLSPEEVKVGMYVQLKVHPGEEDGEPVAVFEPAEDQS